METLKARVEGINCSGHAFSNDHEFLLYPPTEKEHYGTGYYMCVKFLTHPRGREWVDVRYERTTNIEVLARRWINNYYGKNAQKITITKEIKNA